MISVSPTMKQPQGLTNFHFAPSAWWGQSQTALRIRAYQLHPQMDLQELSKDATEFLQMRSSFKYGELMGLSENTDTATEFLRWTENTLPTNLLLMSGRSIFQGHISITEQVQSWEAWLSPQEPQQQLSHQTSCFCSYSSLSALYKNLSFSPFPLFKGHIYLHHSIKNWNSTPTAFFSIFLTVGLDIYYPSCWQSQAYSPVATEELYRRLTAAYTWWSVLLCSS